MTKQIVFIILIFFGFINFLLTPDLYTYTSLLITKAETLQASDNKERELNFNLCWEYTGKFDFIASDNKSSFYTSDGEGKIKRIDKNKGEIWAFKIGGKPIIQPVYFNKTLYVISEYSNSTKPTEQNQININNNQTKAFLTAISTDNGISKWKIELHKLPIEFKLFNNNLKLFYEDKERVSLSTINLTASTPTLSQTNYLNLSEERFGFHKKEILENFIYNDFIYIFSGGNLPSDTLVTPVSLRNGFSLINHINSIQKSDDKVFVSSNDNFLYALTLNLKKILWKKRLEGRIKFRPLIFKNLIFVSSVGENILHVLDRDTGKELSGIILDESEEITSSVVQSENSIVIPTIKGLKLFTTGNCSSN